MSAGTAAEKRDQKLDRIAELVAAFILSVSALISSFAGFQSELWDGDQAANYTLAQQARTESSEAATVAGEIIMLDHLLFTQWLNAYANGDRHLEKFYRDRFRSDFSRAVDQWLAHNPRTNPKAPKTPFLMKSYASQAKVDALTLRKTADRYFAKGEYANKISDAYIQATVVLALALFLAGIIQAFKNHHLRMALLVIAMLALLGGTARVVTLPALSLL